MDKQSPQRPSGWQPSPLIRVFAFFLLLLFAVALALALLLGIRFVGRVAEPSKRYWILNWPLYLLVGGMVLRWLLLRVLRPFASRRPAAIPQPGRLSPQEKKRLQEVTRMREQK